MDGSAKLIDLRKLLSERFPHPPPRVATRLVTGLPVLDEPTGGGLPRGAITELISPARSATTPTTFPRPPAAMQHLQAGSDPGRAPTVAGGPGTTAGSASLIHALIRSACRNNYFLALIDGRDSFDPGGLDNSMLRHLLWVRCSKTSDAIKSADLLLRDGNFPLVIVDVILNAPEELRKIPQTNWYRLQRLVESVPTACLVLIRFGMVASAQLTLVLENSWNLATFETDDPLSHLRIVVKRSHLHSELERQISRSG
jgi:hypothetical protein